ncbi:MAG TPA: phosphoribosyltransferase [Phaeodactylibacter sp.]|nr:phosphoribosyltransferase [Phaeodactylibacter sp.]
MQVLNHRDIELRIKRLATQILECNIDEERLILAGINNNGLRFARLLREELQAPAPMPISLTRIRLNPANPLESPAQIETPVDELHKAVIILIDDVANTGRTLFYACQPLMQTLPRSVQIAVLVDRTHKTFPIQADYIGLALATTLQENIRVELAEKGEMGVFLE